MIKELRQIYNDLVKFNFTLEYPKGKIFFTEALKEFLPLIEKVVEHEDFKFDKHFDTECCSKFDLLIETIKEEIPLDEGKVLGYEDLETGDYIPIIHKGQDVSFDNIEDYQNIMFDLDEPNKLKASQLISYLKTDHFTKESKFTSKRKVKRVWIYNYKGNYQLNILKELQEMFTKVAEIYMKEVALNEYQLKLNI